jgi:DNA-binding NtrC family response regulator
VYCRRRDVLDREGYCALALYRAAKAIALLGKIDVAPIVSDVKMPEIDGIDLALAARELCPRTGILLMSGDETLETIGKRRGSEDCPFRGHGQAFRRSTITRQNQRDYPS